jgi:pre-mRNA-splicing factor 38A
MANRTDSSAKQIHGMNPQYILEGILRSKIYNCMYWKEKCFALTSETIIDRAIELKYIGGMIGGSKNPTDFMCLILKLLQIQPDKEIILEYLNNKDYKYLTALAAYYIRLTSKPKDVYLNLEALYVDYRKLRVRNSDGSFKVIINKIFIE